MTATTTTGRNWASNYPALIAAKTVHSRAVRLIVPENREPYRASSGGPQPEPTRTDKWPSP